MDVPCSALGDNVGVPIAVLFTLIVLLGVANGLVRNGEIPDTGAVNFENIATIKLSKNTSQTVL